jgi:hypothetical protein
MQKSPQIKTPPKTNTQAKDEVKESKKRKLIKITHQSSRQRKTGLEMTKKELLKTQVFVIFRLTILEFVVEYLAEGFCLE